MPPAGLPGARQSAVRADTTRLSLSGRERLRETQADTLAGRQADRLASRQKASRGPPSLLSLSLSDLPGRHRPEAPTTRGAHGRPLQSAVRAGPRTRAAHAPPLPLCHARGPPAAGRFSHGPCVPGFVRGRPVPPHLHFGRRRRRRPRRRRRRPPGVLRAARLRCPAAAAILLLRRDWPCRSRRRRRFGRRDCFQESGVFPWIQRIIMRSCIMF